MCASLQYRTNNNNNNNVNIYIASNPRSKAWSKSNMLPRILENTGHYDYTNLRQIPWDHCLYRTPFWLRKGQHEYMHTLYQSEFTND
jgi:hypothetical protein